MKRVVVNMLFVLSVLCALLGTPAFADEANPPGSSVEPASESASGTEPAAEPSDDEAPALNLTETVYKTLMSVASIDRDALFRNQYVWEAVDTQDFGSANEDGSLSEWQMDWYIAHDWSDYGYVIAHLEPGDAVTVNGKAILILGREEWPSGSINWDVYDAIGWDKTVFQTCEGDHAIWISYGIPVSPTAEFLANHPPNW